MCPICSFDARPEIIGNLAVAVLGNGWRQRPLSDGSCRSAREERAPMELGKLGVWLSMDSMTAAEAAAFAKRVEEWGYAALMDPREPRAKCAGALLLAARQHPEADRRDRHRQHLRPRPDGHGEWPAQPRRAIRRPFSARRRCVASADGAGSARPHLRQAGRDDARLSRSHARGALSGADAGASSR